MAICPLQQLLILQGIIKKYGYIDSEVMTIHKKYKSDKMPWRGGFINASLFVVVGYKYKKIWNKARIPKSGPDMLAWNQNVWAFTQPTHA